jgi:hypothetical protein
VIHEPPRACVRRPQGSWALVALVALVASGLVASGQAHAQELESDVPREEETTTPEEPGYEPDQRGNTGDPEDPETQSQGGTGYEPDQRGEHEPPPSPDRMGATGASIALESYSGSRRSPRLEVELGLGLSLTRLQVGGENLVPAVSTGGAGAAIDLALGWRFDAARIGPRLALTVDPSFVLTHVALELDVELLDGPIAPFLRAAIGGSLVAPLFDHGGGTIGGLGVDLAVGARWRLGRGFYLGAELGGAWHVLFRSAAPECVDRCTDGAFDARRAGQSHALQLRTTIFAGFAF